MCTLLTFLLLLKTTYCWCQRRDNIYRLQESKVKKEMGMTGVFKSKIQSPNLHLQNMQYYWMMFFSPSIASIVNQWKTHHWIVVVVFLNFCFRFWVLCFEIVANKSTMWNLIISKYSTESKENSTFLIFINSKYWLKWCIWSFWGTWRFSLFRLFLPFLRLRI